MTNSDGQPGRVLESFTVTNLPSYPNAALVSLSSQLHPLLNRFATYWIAFFPGDPTSFGGWPANITGAAVASESFDQGERLGFSG